MKTPSLLSSLTAALLLAATIYSCQNDARQAAGDGTEVPEGTLAEESEAPLPTLPYIAAFDDTTEKLVVDKNPDFDPSLLTVDALTQTLTTNYPEIALEVDSVSNDTLYLHISDARYLTQQMGTSGATMYMLEATYAYTEMPDITAVHFAFEEGDHAIPGTYTRQSFDAKAPLR